MKSNLLDKLRKSSTIKGASVISESELFLGKDVIPTKYPAFNIALSGDIEGGLTPGLTVFAGKSKHFKSNFCLILAEAYLKKYDDAILLFYDCEFGSPIAYFESMGISPDRVLHTPIASIEQLKHDISVQLDNIERGDKVIIILDSLGNLASKKETEDALDGKTVTDMTRAKAVKSLFRIITAQLTIKNIPMLVIGHTYDTLEMFSKPVVSGGTGLMYGADNVYIVGRRQEKDGNELAGYNFILNAEKSRYIKEKSAIPIQVTFDGGINKYSGMLDIAIDLGFVVKPKNGWYAKVNKESGEISDKNYRMAQTETKEFWDELLNNPKFAAAVKEKYQYNKNLINTEEEVHSEVEEIFEVDDLNEESVVYNDSEV